MIQPNLRNKKNIFPQNLIINSIRNSHKIREQTRLIEIKLNAFRNNSFLDRKTNKKYKVGEWKSSSLNLMLLQQEQIKEVVMKFQILIKTNFYFREECWLFDL